MAVRSLHVLDCGRLVLDKGFVLTYGVDLGKMVEIPVLAFLIKTDDGNVLFDSGIDHDDLRAKMKALRVKDEDLLINRLKGVGITPEQIDLVVQSHLHLDHAGLLRFFPKARVVVQKQEYGFAVNPPPFAKGFYRRHYYNSPGLNWQFVDGDESLMPGIDVIFTPGHTPGHQSLMVDLPQGGKIILSGDCAYMAENLEKEIIPGIFIDPSQALHSLKKLKLLAKITKAQVLHSHSLEGLKKSPESYQ